MACSVFPDPSDNKLEIKQTFDQITLITEGIYSLKNHASTHYTGAVDQLRPEDIGAQPSGNYIIEGDIRLSNNRDPNLHSDTHSIGGSDPLTPQDIGAQPSGNYIVEGDSRLSNNRDPNHHNDTHFIDGDDPITPQDIGAQPSGNYIVEGDLRLSNNRDPNIHSDTHSIGGSDPLTPQDIGAQPSGNYILEGDNRLSDDRYPLPHALSHSPSGSDPINLSSFNIPVLPIKYDDLSNDASELINVKRRTAKAWVNFNGTNIVSIRSSLNVSSIVDNGIGDYTINFNNAFSNTNYCFVTWSRDWNNDNYVVNNLGARLNTSKTTSSIRLINNYIGNSLNYDSLELNAIFFST